MIAMATRARAIQPATAPSAVHMVFSCKVDKVFLIRKTSLATCLGSCSHKSTPLLKDWASALYSASLLVLARVCAANGRTLGVPTLGTSGSQRPNLPPRWLSCYMRGNNTDSSSPSWQSEAQHEEAE